MKNVYLLMFIFFLLGCAQENRNSTNNICSLVSSDKFLAFPISEDVNPISTRVCYFQSSNIEHVAYVNPQNHLLIFSLADKELKHEVHFERDGPNGIRNVVGLYVHNLDSIFIISGVPYLINIADISGNVINRIDISDLEVDGTPPVLWRSIHQNNNPVINKDSILFFSITFPENVSEKKLPVPLAVTYNLLNEVVEFSTITMPNQHNVKKAGDNYFSRDYDGWRWVYSYLLSNDIYSIAYDNSFEVFNGKSKYASKKIRPSRTKSKSVYAGGLSERYLSLIYDPWRKVFYRIFLPEEEVTENLTDDDIISMIESPRTFSVMIMDENLSIIGETMMPEKSFLPEMFFVSSAGLHFGIQLDHPDFDLNYLKFVTLNLQYY